ncbi:MAG: type II toxin-antitoxin system prevent-host-death family antitoxin [Propionibacteriaceae bacterium]|jgi:prevent-host-death family protein|nr:type II toxin-antitoxin system prevent-host-death family antitoxin [Propionibacteriaceae bacterium]
MVTVAVRDLRNDTAGVLQKAREGQMVVLTSRGQDIAHIVAIPAGRRPYLLPAEVIGIPQTDPGLRQDLAVLGQSDSDELGPIQ